MVRREVKNREGVANSTLEDFEEDYNPVRRTMSEWHRPNNLSQENVPSPPSSVSSPRRRGHVRGRGGGVGGKGRLTAGGSEVAD